MPSLLRVLHAVRRRLLIHRRGLLALCAAVLAWSIITTVRPPAPPTEPAWLAAQDLPTGTVLSAHDLVRTRVPRGLGPRAAHDLRSLAGRTLATPLGAGEIASTTQTVGSSVLAGYPGRSAVPVRIPDADVAGLLRPGDHVDLVGADPQQHVRATTVATDVIVVALPRSREGSGSPELSGRLVVFAVPREEVDTLASASAGLFLSPIWNR